MQTSEFFEDIWNLKLTVTEIMYLLEAKVRLYNNAKTKKMLGGVNVLITWHQFRIYRKTITEVCKFVGVLSVNCTKLYLQHLFSDIFFNKYRG